MLWFSLKSGELNWILAAVVSPTFKTPSVSVSVFISGEAVRCLCGSSDCCTSLAWWTSWQNFLIHCSKLCAYGFLTQHPPATHTLRGSSNVLGQRQYPFVKFSLDFSWNQNAPNKSGKIQHWRDVMFVCPVNNQQALWYPGIRMIIILGILCILMFTIHYTIQCNTWGQLILYMIWYFLTMKLYCPVYLQCFTLSKHIPVFECYI